MTYCGCKFLGAVALSLLSAGYIKAQDTRTVTEPVIPLSCAVLKAQLQSVDGVFSDEHETQPDTKRIQAELDKCGKGKAVELAADGTKNAFLSGPLELRGDVTLLIDKGAALYASRDPKDYELRSGSCGIVAHGEKPGCKAFISAKSAKNVSIMGDGIIDERGGAKMLGSNKAWWDLAADVKASGKGRQEVPRFIDTDHTDNFTLYRITLKNSAMTHIAVHYSNGVTLWGVKIDTPVGALNTDGFDPSASTNITVTDSYIRDGDDDIAIKAGLGPVKYMSVVHNHFYSGHGMSVGSDTADGVSMLLVRDLSLDGTKWGIRIKSNATRGGLVDGVVYDDVCIRNSKLPISLTTDYFLIGKTPDSYPVFRNILLHNVRLSGGGKIELNGFDAKHRVGIQFDGVLSTDNSSRYTASIKHADITLGPGAVNLPLSGGEDSTLHGSAATGSPASCEAKFVPFPVTQ